MVQMGQLDVHHDSEITLKLIQTAPVGATLRLATGYFNLTFDYSQALLRDCQATCQLLTAHPTANGFFSMLLLSFFFVMSLIQIQTLNYIIL